MGMQAMVGWRMPRLYLSTASLLVLTHSVMAADLPMTKAPPPAVAASWAGFYLGVHAGYGWQQDDFSQSQAPNLLLGSNIDGIRSKGALYGGQAGYNWQFGRAVTGFEIDFSAAQLSGSNGLNQIIPIGGGVTDSRTAVLRDRVQYLGSVRGRLGWTPSDSVLLYGTAGLGFERADRTSDNLQSTTPPPAAVFTSNRDATDRFGWVAGAGVEAMLGSPNWIGRVEYLHYDMGRSAGERSIFLFSTGVIRDTSGSQTLDVVRAGVSYKFDERTRLAPVAYAKAPAAAPLAGWAGFYVGAHGGYAWGRDPITVPGAFLGPVPDPIRGLDSKGWIAGGHFGHNWQYDRVVAGFEADLSAADINGLSSSVSDGAVGTTTTRTFEDKVQYLGTVRGRLGWLPTPNVLLYGTAGLAWERLETNTDLRFDGAAPGTTRFTAPSDRFGWVAGLGGEVMLGSSNWIGRLEYLHYDFGKTRGDQTLIFDTPPFFSNDTTSTGRQTIDVVRAGVSYKFGPAVAVAAAPAGYAKAPRINVAAAEWAGFYLGAHGGHGWQHNGFAADTFPVLVGDIRSKGWLGGGQLGYNWQIGKVVAGLELDGSATGIKGDTGVVVLGPGDTESRGDNVKYLGSVRGRLGVTPAGSWLLYATGGLAFERMHRKVSGLNTNPGPVPWAITDDVRDQFGVVAGAGVESFIGSSNWIARLEYLHYDFGATDATITTTPVGFNDRSGRQTLDTVRAGVSYKFTP